MNKDDFDLDTQASQPQSTQTAGDLGGHQNLGGAFAKAGDKTKTMISQRDIDIAAGIRHDLFYAIKYETRHGSNGDMTGMQCGAHFVFKWIFQTTWDHVSASILIANRFKFHTCESLFNDAATWKKYGTNADGGKVKGIHIAIGRCLAYFVERGMLPLYLANPGLPGMRLYGVIYQ